MSNITVVVTSQLPSQLLNQWQARVFFWAICVATVWLLEVPLLGGTTVVLVLGIFTMFGRAIGHWSGFGEIGIGAGLMLGLGLSVLIGQLLLMLGVPPYFSQWSVVSAIAIMTLYHYRKNMIDISKSPPTTGIESFTILALALFVFSFLQQWMLPFAAAVLGFERFVAIRLRSQLSRAALSVPVLAMIPVSAALRPDRWWYFYQGNDSQFFESMGWSASHWGVFEHPGFVGGSVANYHWLSYVFVGDLNHLTGLAPWDLFMKAGVLITCVALAGVFIGLRSDTSRGPSSMNWTLSGLAVAAVSGTAFNSLAFSLPMGMMLFVLVHRFTAALPVIREVVLVISMVALVFTKTSTAVVVVIVLASILVFTERVKRFDNWTPVLILGATGTAMYLLVFRGASQLSTLTLEWPNRNEALRAMWDLITSPDVVLQIFLWTFCISQLLSVGLQQVIRQALPFGLLVTAAFLGISLARTDPLTGFVVSVLNFVTFWAILSWNQRRTGADAEQSPISSVTAILMMTIGFGIGAIFRRVLSQLNSLLPIEDLLGSAIWDGVHRSAYLIAVLCFLLFLTLTPRFRGMHRTYLACILLTLGMLGGADRARFIDASTLGPDPLQNWRGGNSAPFPDNDLQIVSRWIRENTPIDIVLASNNFCCPGSDWWYDIVANLDNYKPDPDETVGDPVLEPSFGGDNYLIPAETRRRFYMQGLGHQPIRLGGTISAEQVSRMTASLEFANQPTETVANQLKSGGVSGFVVNLALTQHRDWSQFAEERFRFGNFAYLELR